MVKVKGIYLEEHVRNKIKQYLIAGGLEGRRQSDIIALVGYMVNGEYAKHELELLLAEDKVQKFTNGHKVRWRATEKIMESTRPKRPRRKGSSRKDQGLRS